MVCGDSVTHLIRVSGGRHCLMVQTAVLLQCGVIVTELVRVTITAVERQWVMNDGAVFLLTVGG